MVMEKRATPKGLSHYASGANLDKEMDMWKVHIDKAHYRKGYGIGQIMQGMSFTDSPDCEFISGGESGKDITGMAIGRCANIMHWGFSASPAYMTESAKKVFVNAVFYMAKFNGQKSLVKKWKSMPRNSIDDFFYRESHIVLDHKNGSFKPSGNADKDKKAQYYLDNYKYLYMKRYEEELDEEAKSLGIANNDIKLLEKCIEMLKEDKGSENYSKALILLSRYTEENFTTYKKWKNWFNKNKKKLFFTELGGYKFMVDTRE